MEASRAQLIELAKLVDSGQLRIAIDSTFTLAQAAAAFERSLASGKNGKERSSRPALTLPTSLVPPH